ncbi:MAG: glutaminase domain-containing protein [Candidatus Hydrogenedens sp.]
MFTSIVLAQITSFILLHGIEFPEGFRPPAVPLVVHDPYTSIWSFSNTLTEQWCSHWTGRQRTMSGLLYLDRKVFRFMGPSELGGEAMKQVVCRIYPTRTVYEFEGGGVKLYLKFTTPMLTEDFRWLSTPCTYVEFELVSTDGGEHNAIVYFDIGTDWCVNVEKQIVKWERLNSPAGLILLKAGTVDQPILEKSGDNIRIDWGYVYLVCSTSSANPTGQTVLAERKTTVDTFVQGGLLPDKDDTGFPRAVEDKPVALAVTIPFHVSSQGGESKYVIVAYDDIYSIEFMHEKLRPWYWKEYGDNFVSLLDTVYQEYPGLKQKCEEWDTFLLNEAMQKFGLEYSALVGLTYRHVLGSGKIVVGKDNTPWFFHKECFSNGCIATVDVTYPASPFFALFAPSLLRGMLEPVYLYAKMPEWIFEFSPHDVGTYPKANGQVYGKDKNGFKLESQMPVEECGNMILATTLYAEVTGKIDYPREHWELIEQWANYLKQHGSDPENQLCTDDFAGHLAHNTNLSLKAIVALGAFSKMCQQRHLASAGEWENLARDMAKDWIERAKDEDHFRLTFDKLGSWSMKYNLVWDRILDLNLFPPEVARMEMEYYKSRQNQYGLPLDIRKDYTKTDWLIWCATLTNNKGDFNTLFQPFYRFMNETSDRIPLTDWYDTKTGKCVGFRARPVIGGVYIPFLYYRDLWFSIASKEDKRL